MFPNPNLGKFWRELGMENILWPVWIWDYVQPFGIFYGHLGYTMAIGSI
jgi:hypothetical protein